MSTLTEKENALTQNRSRSFRSGAQSDSQVNSAEGHNNKQPLEYLSDINMNVLSDMEKVLVFSTMNNY